MLKPQNNKHVKFFKALMSEHRLEILKTLGEGEMSVVELSKKILYIEMSSISCHLKVLLDAKLVSYTRRGRNNYYSVNAPALGKGFYNVLKELNFYI